MENFEQEQFTDFTETQAETQNQEEVSVDPLAVGGMPEIREMPSYEKMRDEAVTKYRQDRKINLIYFCIGVAGLVVSFRIFWELLLSRNIMFLVAALFVLFFLAWCYSCIKKFSKLKQDYRYRLNRAVEIMSNVNVFMQVPKEDLERFDRFWQ